VVVAVAVESVAKVPQMLEVVAWMILLLLFFEVWAAMTSDAQAAAILPVKMVPVVLVVLAKLGGLEVEPRAAHWLL